MLRLIKHTCKNKREALQARQQSGCSLQYRCLDNEAHKHRRSNTDYCLIPAQDPHAGRGQVSRAARRLRQWLASPLYESTEAAYIIRVMVTETKGKLQRFLLHEKLLVIIAQVKLRMVTLEFLYSSPSFLQCSQLAAKTLTKNHRKERVRK